MRNANIQLHSFLYKNIFVRTEIHQQFKNMLRTADNLLQIIQARFLSY